MQVLPRHGSKQAGKALSRTETSADTEIYDWRSLFTAWNYGNCHRLGYDAGEIGESDRNVMKVERTQARLRMMNSIPQ